MEREKRKRKVEIGRKCDMKTKQMKRSGKK